MKGKAPCEKQLWSGPCVDAEQMLDVLQSGAYIIRELQSGHGGSGSWFDNGPSVSHDGIMIKCSLNCACHIHVCIYSFPADTRNTHLFLMLSPPAPARSLSLSLFSFVALCLAFSSSLASFSRPIFHTFFGRVQRTLNSILATNRPGKNMLYNI